MQNKIKIIIVDDQKLYRDGFISLMEHANSIDVIDEVANGLELLEVLKIKMPDVILLDLEMPELNGSETLDIVKKIFPDIKIIIVSQYDEEVLIQDFFNRGASAYVPKDSHFETMVKATHTVNTTGIYKGNLPEMAMKKAISAKKYYYKLIFSRREREIIQLVCRGTQTTEIGIALNIAGKTIETHLKEIYKKSKVENRSEFLAYAIKEGLNYLGIS